MAHDSPFLTESNDGQVLSILGFDPLDSLQLRVDHQRPPFAGGEDGGVFCRHPIAGKTLVVPCRNPGVVCHHGEWVQVLSGGNGRLQTFQLLLPQLVGQLQSVSLCETWKRKKNNFILSAEELKEACFHFRVSGFKKQRNSKLTWVKNWLIEEALRL